MRVTSCAVGMLINTQPVMSAAQSGKTEPRINSSCQTAKRYKCGLSFLSSRAAESRGRRRCVVCLSTSAYLTTLTEIPHQICRGGRAQPGGGAHLRFTICRLNSGQRSELFFAVTLNFLHVDACGDARPVTGMTTVVGNHKATLKQELLDEESFNTSNQNSETQA